MKKLLCFVSLLLACVLSSSQQIMPNCSMDDWVLLKNHPTSINDFEATDLIIGRKQKITLITNGEYALNSKQKGFLSIGLLDYFKKSNLFF